MRIEQKQLLDRLLGGWLLVLLRPIAQAIGKALGRNHGVVPRGEIVFIKMVGGGSLLLCLPSLLGLRRQRPDLCMTLVCGRGVAPFAELIGLFDRIEVVEDGKGLAHLLASSGGVLASLMLRRVDTVVDLEVYSILTTVFSLLTCARNRIGFYLESTYWRRNVLTHLVFFNRAAPVTSFYEAVVRLLGAAPATHGECREHLAARLAPEGASGPSGIESSIPPGAFVAVGAGCSEFGSVRLLRPAEWRAFAVSRRESIAGLPWVFLGGEADRGLSEAIAQEVASAFEPEGWRYINLCGGMPLGSSLAVLQRARRFIGIDSALLHAARLLRVPSTSFWGPTTPAARLQPMEGYEEEIHYRPPICSPCLHVAEMPPCKGENICMNLFTSDEVPIAHWYEDASGRSVRRPGGE
jgi:ADP-heptose:LPS heptosyltransferase